MRKAKEKSAQQMHVNTNEKTTKKAGIYMYKKQKNNTPYPDLGLLFKRPT